MVNQILNTVHETKPTNISADVSEIEIYKNTFINAWRAKLGSGQVSIFNYSGSIGLENTPEKKMANNKKLSDFKIKLVNRLVRNGQRFIEVKLI